MQNNVIYYFIFSTSGVELERNRVQKYWRCYLPMKKVNCQGRYYKNMTHSCDHYGKQNRHWFKSLFTIFGKLTLRLREIVAAIKPFVKQDVMRVQRIRHFRVPQTPSFKIRPSAHQPFLWKWAWNEQSFPYKRLST